MSLKTKTVGISLYGLLTKYPSGKHSPSFIGEDVPSNIQFAKELLDEGRNVVLIIRKGKRRAAIEAWSVAHFGKALPVELVEDKWVHGFTNNNLILEILREEANKI